MKTKQFILLCIALGLFLLLSACAAMSQAADKAQACPIAAAGTQFLKNEAYGYCLLYPTGYSVEQPNGSGTTIYVGSLMDVEQPRVSIEVDKAAYDTADEAAEQLAASLPGWNTDPHLWNIQFSSLKVGGESAVVLDNMPGQDISRVVLMVHGGRLYRLTFVPASEDYGDVYTRMESLYAVVIKSFRFID